MITRAGRLLTKLIGAVEQLGMLGVFLFHCLSAAFTPPLRLGKAIEQIYFIGARSTLVILTAGAFTGMVVALQFHDTLARFGSIDLLGSAVGLSLIRELGPVLSALMVIGRAGSAMCAEIGIMRSHEQIDALECMGIDPYRFLLTPKLVAGVISLPALTSLFDVAGIVGAYFVAVILFEAGDAVFFPSLYAGTQWSDVAMGLVKSLAFGLIIVSICAARGFFLHLDPEGAFGAEGVSRTTTNAVVSASIAVLLADYLIGTVML